MTNQPFDRLETLVRIGRVLSSDVSLTQGQILEYVHRYASQMMNMDNMVIGLYDKSADQLAFTLVYQQGQLIDLDNTPNDWEPLMGDARRAEWITREKRPLFLPNLRAWQVWRVNNPETCGEPVASYIGVPMMVGDKLLGVISASHPDQEYVYDESDLKLLQAVADYAAIALDNKVVNTQLKSLVKIGREVSAQLNVNEEEILTLIYEQLSLLMSTENMYVALYDEASKSVRFGLARQDGKPVDVDEATAMAGKSRMWWIITNGEPLLHHTRKAGEAWYQQEERGNVSPVIFPSYLGVPLAVRGKVLGVIALYDPQHEYVYNNADLEILSALADYAAVGLNNAQLYREARNDVIAARNLATLGAAMAALQHRVYNMFSYITPALESLRQRVNVNDAEVVNILDDIEQTVSFTSDLIGRLRNLAATEEDAQEVQIAAVLNSVVLEAQRRFPHIRFQLQLDSPLPIIKAPSEQITEVFMNLVENACRIMSQGGELFLNARLNEGTNTIEARVQDTGPGINPNLQPRLFLKPVPSRSDQSGSSGLGLWLSRLILASLAGNIMIEDTGAHGTTILVILPVRQGNE
jgi:K+-sensing histidine kinase KdpD